MKWLAVIVTSGFLLFIGFSVAQGEITRVLGGLTYEQIEGTWYVQDDVGELWQIAPDLIHIRFVQGVTETERQAFAESQNLEPSTFPLPDGYYRYRYDFQADPIDVLEAVLGSAIVAEAILDIYVKFLGVPNDRYYQNQWNLLKMDLERAWDVTTGTSPVVIGIMDMGIHPEHEDLAETRWTNVFEYPPDYEDDDDDPDCFGRELVDDYWGWDFINDNNEPLPYLIPHGTAVAGMACAVSNNAKGNASVGGGRAGNRPIKWASAVAWTGFQEADAVRYFKCKGIKIISMSFTESCGDPYTSLFERELKQFYDAGGLAFAGSGNEGESENHHVRFPANSDYVVAVGATDTSDVRWNYSNYGPELDLVAPSGRFTGPSVWSTDNDGTLYPPETEYNPTWCPCRAENQLYYSRFGGTSAATPEAAAVAALLWSYNPALTNDEVRSILQRSARDLGDPGWDEEYGFGRVDAYRTLTQWGTIPADTTWGAPGSPNVIFVSGDLTIAAGATLTINAETTVNIALDDNEGAGSFPEMVEVTVDGSLQIAGTSQDPVVFQAWNGHEPGDWVGICFDSTSQDNDLDGLIIKHAKIAIENYAPVTLSNSIIDSRETGIEAHAGISSTGEVTIKNAGWGVKNFADITLDGFTISDCVEGIESHDDITVQNSTLNGHSSYGLQVLAGHATLDNVTISDCGIGIDVNASPASFAAVACTNNSVIRDVDFHGITASASNDTVRATETTIESGASGLSLILGAWARLEGCTIRNNDTGVLAIGTDQVEVTSCLIDSNTTSGIYCVGGSDITIEDNTISHSSAGIFCLNNSDATIADSNWVKTNTIGIKCDGGSSPLIRRNKISDNAVGISALNDADPDVGVSCEDSCEVGGCETEGANEIVSNSSHDIVNLSPSVTILAECNYWGPNGPKASKFSGAVDYDPSRDNDPLPNLVASRPPGDQGDEEEKPPEYPVAYDLSYSYPNPFNPVTTIRYDVPQPGGVVTLAIYNVRGEALRTLVDEEKPAGSHSVKWDGRDDRGVAAASGVYFVRMTAGDFKKTQKLVLTK